MDTVQQPPRLTAYSTQFRVWAKIQDNEYRGQLMHLHNHKGYGFCSTLDLFYTVSECLDAIGAAAVGFKPRGWIGEGQQRGDEMKPKEILNLPKCSPTFVINVQRRQNATWQGTIQWLDGERKQNFRSILELMHLMEEIVSQAPIPADDITLNPPHWEDEG